MNKDLTQGNPETVLWKFCLPLFGSVVFQQLYNIADSWVAGRFIGENALAAVGNSYEITLIFIAFSFGCNIGCSVVTSRYFGAKDYRKMKTAVSTSILASGAVCGVLMILGLMFGAAMLTQIQTPAEVYDDSLLYLNIYIYGLPFVMFYNLATGIFSALGDSRTPFLFLAASSLSNIGVDILFVSAFHMGVSGVAWATFLCQGVSCITALAVVVHRMKGIPGEGRGPLFSLTIFRQFAVIAIPSILQQSFISIGNIMIQGFINGFGAGVMAGYSAGVKLNNLVITSFTTIGNGISNYTSQNIGANKQERIPQGYRAGLKLVWTLCVPFCLLYLIFPRILLCFFMDSPSAAALSSGTIYLRILAPFYFIVSAKLVADGNLRGAGMMKPFMTSTFTDLILRVVLAYFFSRTALGSTGIWCAWPVGWIVSTSLSTLFYRRGFTGAGSGSRPSPRES